MFKLTIKPAFCHTDALGHISNTIIPEWFESARDPVFLLFSPDLDPQTWHLILARYDIEFKAELYYGKDVEIHTWIDRIGTSSIHVRQQVWQDNRLGVEGVTILVHFDHKRKKSSPIPDSVRDALSKHLKD